MYWTKQTYNKANGQPVVKVYTNGNRAPLQVEQFSVVDGDWQKAEAAAKAWIAARA
jgi:hypothetical protein